MSGTTCRLRCTCVDRRSAEVQLAEVFTRPEYKAQVAAYYSADDLAEVESKPPFTVISRS